MIKDNCDRLGDALMEDLGRPALEAQMYVTQLQYFVIAFYRVLVH